MDNVAHIQSVLLPQTLIDPLRTTTSAPNRLPETRSVLLLQMLVDPLRTTTSALNALPETRMGIKDHARGLLALVIRSHVVSMTGTLVNVGATQRGRMRRVHVQISARTPAFRIGAHPSVVENVSKTGAMSPAASTELNATSSKAPVHLATATLHNAIRSIRAGRVGLQRKSMTGIEEDETSTGANALRAITKVRRQTRHPSSPQIDQRGIKNGM